MNRLILAVLLCVGISGQASSQFVEIINTPPDNFPGQLVGTFKQLNIHDGAYVPSVWLGESSSPNTGLELNVLGGEVGSIRAYQGTTTNIRGGKVYDRLEALDGSAINIFSGPLPDTLAALPDSMVTLFGGEFTVNGVPTSIQLITITNSDVLAGTLEDGSVFVLPPITFLHNPLNVAKGQVTTVPLVGAPLRVLPDGAAPPHQLRTGQRLEVGAHASLPDGFVASGGEIRVEGGTIGDEAKLAGVTLSMESGSIGDGLLLAGGNAFLGGGKVGRGVVAYSNSDVHIDGAKVGPLLQAKSGSQIRMTSGEIGAQATAEGGSRFRIHGGTVESLRAELGSDIEISGGRHGSGLNADPGSSLVVSGGSFGYNFRVTDFFSGNSTHFELVGNDFELNGDRVVSSTVTPRSGDMLTGVLSDGSTFIFNDGGGTHRDSISAEVKLTLASLPEPSPLPEQLAHESLQVGLRRGQAATLGAGERIRAHYAVIGANLTIAGGAVGDGFEAADAQLSLTSGELGNNARITQGSSVIIEGGTIGSYFEMDRGGELTVKGGIIGDSMALGGIDSFTMHGGVIGNDSRIRSANTQIIAGVIGGSASISGNASVIDGTFGDVFQIEPSSQVTITGGNFGNGMNIRQAETRIEGGRFGNGFTTGVNSIVEISGGVFGPQFKVEQGAIVVLRGGDFQLNGVAVAEEIAQLQPSDVLAGVFTDGTPFLFSPLTNDMLMAVQFEIAPPPMATETPVGTVRGLRPGQRLTLESHESLPDDFALIGAELQMNGGIVGDGMELFDSVVKIEAGEVEGTISVLDQSILTVSGGTFRDAISVFDGGKVHISGGNLGQQSIEAHANAIVEISATEFLLDGSPIDGLSDAGDTIVLDQRRGLLTASLLDGASYELRLFNLPFKPNYIDPSATLRLIVRVPEPVTSCSLMALLWLGSATMRRKSGGYSWG